MTKPESGLKLPGSKPDRWFVVRKSRTILGGYRVVKTGLTEDEAKRWAASYCTPHQAMRESEVLGLRMKAIKEARNG